MPSIPFALLPSWCSLSGVRAPLTPLPPKELLQAHLNLLLQSKYSISFSFLLSALSALLFTGTPWCLFPMHYLGKILWRADSSFVSISIIRFFHPALLLQEWCQASKIRGICSELFYCRSRLDSIWTVIFRWTLPFAQGL